MNERLRALAEQISNAKSNNIEATWQFDPVIRAWREDFIRRFGYAPNLDTPGYNYRLAIAAGNRPNESGHWPQDTQVAPMQDSVQLKAENHPTAWKGPVYAVTGTEPNEMTEEQWREAESKGALAELEAALRRYLGPEGSLRRTPWYR